MPRDDKVAILKDSLSLIGKRIEHVLNQKEAAGEDRQRWRRHLWRYAGFFRRSLHFTHAPSRSFVTLFWPKKVKASKLEEIHAKMVMKDQGATRGGSSDVVVKKSRPGTSSKTNGASAAGASSAARTNGKGYR